MNLKKKMSSLLGLVIVVGLLGFAMPSFAYNLPAVGLIGQYTDAAGIIGTEDFTNNSYTQTATPDTQGINAPNGITIDKNNDRIWITDTLRHRVLSFDVNPESFDLKDGNADLVLGQADFTHFSANRSDTVTAAGLDSPWGIAFDSNHDLLYVSDSANSRILIYDASTVVLDGSNAVGVIGQPDFTTKTTGLAQNKLNTPTGIAYDAVNDRLFVADSGNNRVLVYNNPGALTVDRNADIVIGQVDYVTKAAPSTITAATMNTPMGVAYDSIHDRLFVTDRDNHRVLSFVGGLTDGMSASNVLGQTSMALRTAAKTKSGLRLPVGLAYDGRNDRLFVSEYSYTGTITSNDRVMLFDVSTIDDGESAVGLIGKELFTDANDSTVNNTTLHQPTGLLYIDESRELFIADNARDRIMIFQFPSITNYGMPTAKVGLNYQPILDGSGGNAPYTFSLISGLAGINSANISFMGQFWGFPTKTGSFDVSVKLTDDSIATDQSGFTDISNFTIVIEPAGAVVDVIAPTVPSNLTALAATSSQINLSWSPSLDDGSGVAGYKIYKNGSLTPLVTVVDTNYNDTALTPETTYSYKVSAVDLRGNESPMTAAVSTKTLAVGQTADAVKPTAPVLSATAPSSSQIDLSWSGATDNVGVIGYKLYRGDAVIASTGSSTYSDTGLAADTNYTYYIVSQDAANNFSNKSAVISIKTVAGAVSTKSNNTKKKEDAPKRVIKNSTRTVSRGDVLVQSGKAFSKNSTVSLFYTNKNGTYVVKPVIIKTNKKGAFSTSFKVNKLAGKYSWYVVDGKSGRKSKVKTYIVN
jgi:DNA-binding beta-propeller fold protein YncE/chitodextrinase